MRQCRESKFHKSNSLRVFRHGSDFEPQMCTDETQIFETTIFRDLAKLTNILSSLFVFHLCPSVAK